MATARPAASRCRWPPPRSLRSPHNSFHIRRWRGRSAPSTHTVAGRRRPASTGGTGRDIERPPALAVGPLSEAAAGPGFLRTAHDPDVGPARQGLDHFDAGFVDGQRRRLADHLPLVRLGVEAPHAHFVGDAIQVRPPSRATLSPAPPRRRGRARRRSGVASQRSPGRPRSACSRWRPASRTSRGSGRPGGRRCDRRGVRPRRSLARRRVPSRARPARDGSRKRPSSSGARPGPTSASTAAVGMRSGVMATRSSNSGPGSTARTSTTRRPWTWAPSWRAEEGVAQRPICAFEVGTQRQFEREFAHARWQDSGGESTSPGERLTVFSLRKRSWRYMVAGTERSFNMAVVDDVGQDTDADVDQGPDRSKCSSWTTTRIRGPRPGVPGAGRRRAGGDDGDERPDGPAAGPRALLRCRRERLPHANDGRADVPRQGWPTRDSAPPVSSFRATTRPRSSRAARAAGVPYVQKRMRSERFDRLASRVRTVVEDRQN